MTRPEAAPTRKLPAIPLVRFRDCTRVTKSGVRTVKVKTSSIDNPMRTQRFPIRK